jgi:hypothetical protein
VENDNGDHGNLIYPLFSPLRERLPAGILEVKI